MRLIGRGSLPGAVVVLAIAALYAVALPMVAARASAPPPPRIVAIGDGAMVTSSPDWSEAVSDGSTTTLTLGGAVLSLHEPAPADAPVAVELGMLTDAWMSQAPDGSVSTQPRAFATDAGDDAATVVVQEPQQTVQAWVVSDGTLEVVAVLTAPATSWDAASSSAQTLIRSLRFPAPTSAPPP